MPAFVAPFPFVVSEPAEIRRRNSAANEYGAIGEAAGAIGEELRRGGSELGRNLAEYTSAVARPRASSWTGEVRRPSEDRPPPAASPGASPDLAAAPLFSSSLPFTADGLLLYDDELSKGHSRADVLASGPLPKAQSKPSMCQVVGFWLFCFLVIIAHRLKQLCTLLQCCNCARKKQLPRTRSRPPAGGRAVPRTVSRPPPRAPAKPDKRSAQERFLEAVHSFRAVEAGKALAGCTTGALDGTEDAERIRRLNAIYDERVVPELEQCEVREDLRSPLASWGYQFQVGNVVMFSYTMDIEGDLVHGAAALAEVDLHHGFNETLVTAVHAGGVSPDECLWHVKCHERNFNIRFDDYTSVSIIDALDEEDNAVLVTSRSTPPEVTELRGIPIEAPARGYSRSLEVVISHRLTPLTANSFCEDCRVKLVLSARTFSLMTIMPNWALRRIANIFAGKFLRQLSAHSTESQDLLDRVTSSDRAPLYCALREHLAERFGEDALAARVPEGPPSFSHDPDLLGKHQALLAGFTKREQDILLPLKGRIEQEDGWELVSNVRDLECCRRRVDCWTPGRERPMWMWRLRKTMTGATAKEVFDLVMDGPATPTWHRHVSSLRLVNREHGATLLATCFKGVFPVSAREALEFRAASAGAVEETGEYWIAYTSVGTLELNVPVAAKHERTFTSMAGYRIRPGAEPGTAEFTLVIHTDPCGNLSDRVVDMAGPKGGKDYIVDLQKGLNARRKVR